MGRFYFFCKFRRAVEVSGVKCAHQPCVGTSHVGHPSYPLTSTERKKLPWWASLKGSPTFVRAHHGLAEDQENRTPVMWSS